MIDEFGSRLRCGYAAILLAAGRSRRMGAPKHLLDLGGKPMIRHVVETVLRSRAVSNVIVVIGYEAQKMEEALVGAPAVCVLNPEFVEGEMLSSVKAGLESVSISSTAFFLMPADQPLIKSSTFDALAAEFATSGAMFVQPAFEGKRGHPVLISTELIPEILALPGSETLKAVLSRYKSLSTTVDLSDRGIVFDIDTPEGYLECLDILKASS